MRLFGLHHLSAVTADIVANRDFYTRVLGLRLVKKTVNQDDVRAYHLFYADGLASPGSDITFFDYPSPRERRGTGSVSRTGLRVAGEEALHWWRDHLRQHGVDAGAVARLDGRWTLDFEDPEGQRLRLVDDGGVGPAHPWARSPIAAAHQVRGLGPVTLSVRDLAATQAVLERVLGMRRERAYRSGPDDVETQVFAMGDGGPGAELHVAVEPGQSRVSPGAGGVHHVAFGIEDDTYEAWAARLDSFGIRSSGPVDRYYFRSLYFRDPSGVLFEIATRGPGFAADENPDTLGERLALPPFLEGRRHEIEGGLRPLTGPASA